MLPLTPAMKKFVLHWGEMGDAWGINRSVAQIHALLYVTGKPLHAEEIAETLDMARSNVSTSLRELQTWGLARAAHVLGDRRDHYETSGDVWETFMRVLDERRRREIEPTIRILEECIAEAERSKNEPELTLKRLGALHQFVSSWDAWYVQMRKLPKEALAGLVKMGGKLSKMLQA
jgi:DNA-binding transcriptional regulator GbsR (MarR family)